MAILFLLFLPGRDEITCVGNFLVINEGEYYENDGRIYVNHAMYGKQFQVSVAKAGTPKTVSAMEKYLGSGAIKGIGVPMAKRIVDHFGEATFDIIDNNPERLVEMAVSKKSIGYITPWGVMSPCRAWPPSMMNFDILV